MGKQNCKDTGQLTRKRMETADDEFLKAGIDFMERANKAGKPFFVWSASTRMHIFTHLKPESKGKTGLGVYADGMVEHDSQVGQWLAELNKLGVANNTIVMYTTDNGAELLLWPDGGMIPFHGEKNTTWDGGFRVPMMVRWPGHIKPGTTSSDIVSLLDWMPTLMAAAGKPDIKDKLMKGYTVRDKTYKVHLDGYDQTAMLTGNGAGARKEFFYSPTTVHSRRCATTTGRCCSGAACAWIGCAAGTVRNAATPDVIQSAHGSLPACGRVRGLPSQTVSTDSFESRGRGWSKILRFIV
jgi:arylsulfatase